MKAKYLIVFLITVFLCVSCKKFLDEKTDRSLVIPSSLKDLQAMLDNSARMNMAYPYTIEIGSDDYYITTADWQARVFAEKNAHIWSPETFVENYYQWGIPYTVVYHSNVVLHELESIEPSIDPTTYSGIKGQALFFRSFAFHSLLLSFAKPYSADSAGTQWGIPLRLDPDFNKPTKRATLKESYDQIIGDVKASIRLLPDQQQYKTRPSKNAAYAFLSRIFLSMREYDLALKYADSALQLNNTLVDYNSLTASATNPVPLFNTECIFHSVFQTANTTAILSKVDSTLFRSYATDDLRRTIFFKVNTDGSYSFKGSYDGSVRLFNGLANDEMYLIKAECLARAGNTTEAINNVNTLLLKRWKTNRFTPLNATDPVDALTKILIERRKELLMRGIRWSDLRRLNKEPPYAITIKRFLANQEYVLYPNSPRYVFKIPNQVVQMTGIPQND